MELWIKTQEKRLVQIVDFLEPRKSEKGETYHLWGFSSIGSFIKLGIYENKERALEVLDEIQEFMTLDEEHYEGKNKVAYQQCNMYKSNLLMIYEMPQE